MLTECANTIQNNPESRMIDPEYLIIDEIMLRFMFCNIRINMICKYMLYVVTYSLMPCTSIKI